ncbi:MAG: FAD-binding oxidoreductase [Clostridia bacterium]|nr:FAD-binding oxidoreductase [Clostridia bacterium]
MLNELKEVFGARYTDSPFERRFYSRDVAYLPEFLISLLSNPLPDMVFRPLNAEEVSRIIPFATVENLAVTPRAGASTALGNSVPTRGGIVLDLNALKGVVRFSASEEKVRVLPGTTWAELDSYLRPRGYTVCAYPTSAFVATIGGWFSVGGYGIGSIEHGPLVNQVSSLEVVLPSGEIRRLTQESEPPLQWFAGTDGTLGVITELELKVRPVPEAMSHFLLVGKDPAGLIQAAQDCLAGMQGILHNLHYNSKAFNQALKSKGLVGSEPGNYHSLSVDLEGTRTQLDQGEAVLQSIVTRLGLRLLDSETAREEWENRFQSLRVMRVHPCLLGGELLLPLNSLNQYLEQLENLGRRAGVEMLTYGHIVSPDKVLVMSLYPADERRTFRYLCDTSLIMEIYRLGIKLDGVPYLVGFWNTPYVKDIYNSERLAELKRRKTLLDPKGIMNPSKAYRPPLLLRPALFTLGMKTLGMVRQIFTKEANRHEQQ